MSGLQFVDDLHRALMLGVSPEELVDRHEGDWSGLMDILCECGEAIGIKGASLVPAEKLMPVPPDGGDVPPVKVKVMLQMRPGAPVPTRATDRWARVFLAICLAPQRDDSAPNIDSSDGAGTPPSKSALLPPAHQAPEE